MGYFGSPMGNFGYSGLFSGSLAFQEPTNMMAWYLMVLHVTIGPVHFWGSEGFCMQEIENGGDSGPDARFGYLPKETTALSEAF